MKERESTLRKKPNAFTRKNRKAFAWPRAIIALLILAIALLAMAFGAHYVLKLALQTVQKERALVLAYERLDALEALAPQSADIASTDTVGMYTISFDRSLARGNGIVQVSWGGITQPSTVTLQRDMSEESYLTATQYKE
jgi:Tfp pilus assembly protein PilV